MRILALTVIPLDVAIRKRYEVELGPCQDLTIPANSKLQPLPGTVALTASEREHAPPTDLARVVAYKLSHVIQPVRLKCMCHCGPLVLETLRPVVGSMGLVNLREDSLLDSPCHSTVFGPKCQSYFETRLHEPINGLSAWRSIGTQ